MPETTALSTLEQRVAAAVEQHRAELERLVRVQVDRLLGELVDTELANRSNGNTATGAPRQRRCNRWGELNPAGAYDRHRGTCRQCRQQQARDREHRAHAVDDDGEGPVQARPPTSTAVGVSAYALLARRDNLGQLAPGELEAWLVTSGLAVPDGAPGLLAPTPKAIALGGALGFLG